MKVKEIIDQLHYFQKWRRGANLKQPDPTEIQGHRWGYSGVAELPEIENKN